MKHLFGTNDFTGTEVLKTKGPAHTNLTGFQSVVAEYDDCTITDSFRVVRKTNAAEDAEGNCYDWYEIDKHNRIINYAKAIKSDIYAEMAAAYAEGVQSA